MSDTVNDPQPTDPPTNTGGGGTPSEAEDIQTEAAPMTDPPTEAAAMTDPPTNTGGGGSA